jgi:hypothetical protein
LSCIAGKSGSIYRERGAFFEPTTEDGFDDVVSRRKSLDARPLLHPGTKLARKKDLDVTDLASRQANASTCCFDSLRGTGPTVAI